jgi:DNA-binding NtrC family response regulator
VLQRLENYVWSGNVRELRNLCERFVLLHAGQVIEINHLPIELQVAQPTTYTHYTTEFILPDNGLNLGELEINLIRQALTKTYGNLSQAARLLGLSRDTLLYRVKKHAITF